MVCCKVPEVAVMVTVEILGGGPKDKPGQPVSSVSPQVTPHKVRNRRRKRTPLRFFQPKKHNPTARAEPGSQGCEFWERELRELGPRLSAATVEAVVMVRVALETVPLARITLGCTKAHVAPVGSPVQAKETLPANPLIGVNVTVVATPAPGATVSDAGATETVKSATSALDVVAVA